jgi:hypothetical protein
LDNFVEQTYKTYFNSPYEVDFATLKQSIILKQRYLLTYQDLCFIILSFPGKVPAEQALKGPYANEKGTIILDYFAVSVLNPQKGIGYLMLSTVLDCLKRAKIYKRMYLECYLPLISYYQKFGAYVTGHTTNPGGIPFVYMVIDF